MFEQQSLEAGSDEILSTHPQLMCNTKESITRSSFLQNFFFLF